MIAPYPLHLEPRGCVERDRAGIVGPDFELELVRVLGARVLDGRPYQGTSASAPARPAGSPCPATAPR